MSEILQIVEEMNRREHVMTIAEAKEYVTLVEQKAPGFSAQYIRWRGIESWMLVPVSALQAKGEQQG